MKSFNAYRCNTYCCNRSTNCALNIKNKNKSHCQRPMYLYVPLHFFYGDDTRVDSVAIPNKIKKYINKTWPCFLENK